MAKDRGPSEDRIDSPDGSEPKTARGKALPRSDADLDMLSEVRQADVRDARVEWKKRTLPGYGGLIEAELEPDEG